MWYGLVRERLRKESAISDGVLSLRELRWVLGICFHVPRDMQIELISELVELGVIERVSNKRVRVV